MMVRVILQPHVFTHEDTRNLYARIIKPMTYKPLFLLLVGLIGPLVFGNTAVNVRSSEPGGMKSLVLDTALELKIRIKIIKDNMADANSSSVDRDFNELAFRLVLIAENESLDTVILKAINEVEDVLGGGVVTAPIFFKEERDVIDRQIKEKLSPSYQRTMYIFEYTRKIRELAAKKGLPIPEYKGITRGRL